MKKTKIICSIGPVSRNYETMKNMVLAGMNAARINFSHADEIEKSETVELVKKLNKDINKNVAVLFDTKGPDFRTGVLENGEINLIEGNLIKITKEDIIGNTNVITVNYKEMIDAINIGNTVLLEDGLMKLEVIEKSNDDITCKIINGGILGNRKGVAVPGVPLNVPFISKQDKEDIIYACQNDGDFLALSFVSSKEDIFDAKKILVEQNNTHMQIISKVETATAIKNIDEIIEHSDGIMVARGDLGVEVPMPELPILQKMIVEKCRLQGKFCIVATEMLSSMQKNARPTRAEVSDIANAVLDGADAVMLSGETTVGKYPIDAVKMMADICENTERHMDYHNQTDSLVKNDITSIIARSVVDAANYLEPKAILAATLTGYTAKKISTLRPNSVIIAGVPNEEVARKLALSWGVYVTMVPAFNNTDEVIDEAILKANEVIKLEKDDVVIVTGGFHKNPTINSTNLLKIQVI